MLVSNAQEDYSVANQINQRGTRDDVDKAARRQRAKRIGGAIGGILVGVLYGTLFCTQKA